MPTTHYWLMKSEPSSFSIDDLQREQTTTWDGVRNYQARNMLRDVMQVDDLAFFYHSNCTMPSIVGIMKIIRGGYPDKNVLNSEYRYFDPKATPDNPRWYCVDVQFIEKFSHQISLQTLKQHNELKTMPLLQRGNRLSIMPVTQAQWHFILALRQ